MSDLSNSKSALLPVQKDVLKAFASVLELIPRTLFENAGVTDVARKMLELKCKINSEEKSPEKIFGIDGISGQIENNKKLNIWDAFSIKEQCIKNSFETALLVITIDEIVAVTKGKKSPMQDMEH
ncbi:MAG: T-complex protein 1 subunit gamma [Paramarteilia canceri]